MLDKETLELKMGQIGHYIKSLQALVPTVEELAKESNTVRDYVIDEIAKFALSVKTAKLDKDELNGFFDHPYVIWQERKDKPGEWHIGIPKIFSSINLGWLDRVTSSHNIFLVNRFSEWFGEIPALLKKELNLQDPLDIKLTADKRHVTGSDIDKAQEKYGRFITKRDGNKLEIDQTRYFQFLANLIDDGILPFTQSPIPASHLRTEKLAKFELRQYQKEAIDTLKKYGHIGVYFPPSTGKTFIGMDAICEIKVESKRWLIVVPRTTLIEQWQENLSDFTAVDNSEYVIVTYQSAIKKYMEEEFTGMIIDECLPYDARVITENGKIEKIGTLVHKKYSGNVLSYNFNQQIWEEQKVTNWFKTKPKTNIVRVNFSQRFSAVTCTANHKFYSIKRGWLEARDLKIGEHVIVRPKSSGRWRIPQSLGPMQWEILKGTLLGDASISYSDKMARIRLVHSVKQKPYLDHKIKMLKSMIWSTPKHQMTEFSKTGVFVSTSASSVELADRIWDDLRLVEEISAIGLAYWFMDDGSIGIRSARINTQGRPFELVEKMVMVLRDKFKLDCKVNKTAKGPVIDFSTKGTWQLANLISKYVIPSMRYKLWPEAER